MVNRRDFLKIAGASAASLALSGTSSQLFASPSAGAPAAARHGDKVNVAFVGIGGRGDQVELEMSATGMINVLALCDVDMGAEHTLRVMNKYPKARRYRDFRLMFDEMSSKIDAVIVCTPDFSHFPIAMRAIKEGKHVYVEKPLAQTFYECELLMQASAAHPEVVTQMGNQGHSEANYFQFKAWKDAGIIKDVTRIDAHMNAGRRWHNWDPKLKKFPDAQPIPETLDWDMWLMGKLHHDFNHELHYGNWRSWYDFGMGALGDWGAHIFDTCHEFLELGLPYEVGMERCDDHNDFFFPMASTIRFRFPRRGSMPACEMYWYDGVGNLPKLPEGYGKSEVNPNVPTAGENTVEASSLNPGKIIYSRDLIFKGGSHDSTLQIIPSEAAREMEKYLPEVPKSPSNHYANFLLACQGREKTRSPFALTGVMTQMMALGVIAQRLNTTFRFDAATKEIVGNPFANALLYGPAPKDGWQEYYKL